MKSIAPFLSKILLVIIILISTPYSSSGVIIPQIEIITAGMERTIYIQSGNYPEDFSQFIVFILGYGTLNIKLSKEDTEGDKITFMGIAISPAGIIPFYKSGKTAVTLMTTVTTGTKQRPLGLVWFTTWISSSSEEEPPYNYTLTLKLRQVEFEP